MTTTERDTLPSTPVATAAVAQSRTGEASPGMPGPEIPYPDLGTRFGLGRGVERAVRTQPYERQSKDPLYRPLRIFTLDPATSRFEGATATVNVPYEPLEKGPASMMFGDALRSKIQVAQFNETMCKVLCHNLCVVIQSMHELGIAPEFGVAQTA